MRTVLLVSVAAIITAFLMINWPVLVAPARVSLFLTSANVPIGVVMLGLLALLIITLTLYVGIWQRALLIEYRRLSKELEAQRALAENVEASRFSEMSSLIRVETSELAARVERALDTLAAEFRATENSIAAVLGEMDDRIRGHPAPDGATGLR